MKTPTREQLQDLFGLEWVAMPDDEVYVAYRRKVCCGDVGELIINQHGLRYSINVAGGLFMPDGVYKTKAEAEKALSELAQGEQLEATK